ncbi:MAG TPA: hypothetical protein VF331_01325 [Polyangiales bacterium]
MTGHVSERMTEAWSHLEVGEQQQPPAVNAGLERVSTDKRGPFGA